MKINKRRVLLIGVAFVILVTLGYALARVAYAATTMILAVGTIPQSQLVDGPATVTVRTLTLAPNEVGAWHYHPGYAFNVVKSGALTVEDGCGGEETLNPSDAFEETEGRVHRARNLGSDPVVVYNTFIVPMERGTTTVNIPGNIRQCGPPNTVDQCKDNRWMQFTWPNPFNNQGECVAFVLHRATITLPVPVDPLK
jgi:quercetin dioxygenase-like cupin family protein